MSFIIQCSVDLGTMNMQFSLTIKNGQSTRKFYFINTSKSLKPIEPYYKTSTITQSFSLCQLVSSKPSNITNNILKIGPRMNHTFKFVSKIFPDIHICPFDQTYSHVLIPLRYGIKCDSSCLVQTTEGLQCKYLLEMEHSQKT